MSCSSRAITVAASSLGLRVVVRTMTRTREIRLLANHGAARAQAHLGLVRILKVCAQTHSHRIVDTSSVKAMFAKGNWTPFSTLMLIVVTGGQRPNQLVYTCQCRRSVRKLTCSRC